MSGTWSQVSIKTDMAAIIGRYVRDIPATSCGTVPTYFIYRATTRYSSAFECKITVKTMYIDYTGHIALWLTMMEGQQSLTLCWRSFWRLGSERCTLTFAYNGSLYSVYHILQPVDPKIPHATWPTTIDVALTLIFLMWQGWHCNLFCQ